MEIEVVPPEPKERLAASLDVTTDFPRKGEEVKSVIVMVM